MRLRLTRQTRPGCFNRSRLRISFLPIYCNKGSDGNTSRSDRNTSQGLQQVYPRSVCMQLCTWRNRWTIRTLHMTRRRGCHLHQCRAPMRESLHPRKVLHLPHPLCRGRTTSTSTSVRTLTSKRWRSPSGGRQRGTRTQRHRHPQKVRHEHVCTCHVYCTSHTSCPTMHYP